jgi:general stress protein 26
VTSELQKFYDLVRDIEIAMMTTRRADGHLESRAMATQKQADGADLWFVTLEGSQKLSDIAHDPHVNLAYLNVKTMEWISVSALARITNDRQKIHELYMPDWKIWFPEGDDARHGTPEDPRMVLIAVDIHAAVFLEVNKPKPVVLYELAKGWFTGREPDIGEMHRISGT